MTTVWRRYRTVLAVAVLAALAMTRGGLAEPLRALAVLALIGFIPGAALLPWLPQAGRTQRGVMAVAISLALTAILSEALAIAGAWSADWVIVGVAAIGVTAILCRRWAP